MAKAVRLKAPAMPVPQTRDQVVEAIAEIGRSQRARTLIETAMNDEIARIKQRYEAEAEPLGERITALSAGVQSWCEANRHVITDGGKTKTAVFPSGEVKWRSDPPSVKLKAIDVVLQLLKERGLARFIRVKEEPNKEAMLADPDAVAGVPGIRFEQREQFVIEPFEAKLDVA